jgi:hypothetical protein
MITAGELTKVIAFAIDMDLQVVTRVFRALREENFLTKGGRGPSAPPMTPLDAARVLIALLVSDRPVDAATIVREVGQFQLHYLGKGPNEINAKVGDRFEDNLASLLVAISNVPIDASNQNLGSIEANLPDLFIGVRLHAFGAEHRYAHPEWFVSHAPDEMQAILTSDARAVASPPVLALGKRLAPTRREIRLRIGQPALNIVAAAFREM